MKLFHDEIAQFVADEKAKNAHLLSFKKTLKGIIPIKQQEKMHYQQFAKFLQGYESSRDSKSGGVGELAHVKLIEGEGDGLMVKLESMAAQHQNPLAHIHHWVKSEVWCLEALGQAIADRDAVETKKKNA